MAYFTVNRELVDPDYHDGVVASRKEDLLFQNLVGRIKGQPVDWEQKVQDILDYKIDVCVMGSDWAGSDKFDYLKEYCDVVFLERTPGISTSMIKNDLQLQETVDGVDQVPRT